jgi:hypothetical protein
VQSRRNWDWRRNCGVFRHWRASSLSDLSSPGETISQGGMIRHFVF